MPGSFSSDRRVFVYYSRDNIVHNKAESRTDHYRTTVQDCSVGVQSPVSVVSDRTSRSSRHVVTMNMITLPYNRNNALGKDMPSSFSSDRRVFVYYSRDNIVHNKAESRTDHYRTTVQDCSVGVQSPVSVVRDRTSRSGRHHYHSNRNNTLGEDMPGSFSSYGRVFVYYSRDNIVHNKAESRTDHYRTTVQDCSVGVQSPVSVVRDRTSRSSRHVVTMNMITLPQ
ncbi:hypothetical protein J6590_059417 [Homalodisca vitripennis]|nr:hypothetical protein J6590_059417 [Homalodisca vitripennis]